METMQVICAGAISFVKTVDKATHSLVTKKTQTPHDRAIWVAYRRASKVVDLLVADEEALYELPSTGDVRPNRAERQ
jgi:hypothetical protein